MTKPAIETYYRNGARWYSHPLADDPEAPNSREHWSPLAIGVTSVLGTLNKPALTTWSAKMAATFAVEEKAAWENLTSVAAKVELIQNASKRYAKAAGDVGTAAHAACESIANWRFLDGARPDSIPVELEGFVKSYLLFLKESGAKAIRLEQTVWNHKLGYAGTFDGLFEIKGRLAVVDTKTSQSGIYSETALQQVAYKNGEVIVHPDGREEPMPEVEDAYALWLRPNGYALHPLDVGERTWETWQHLVEVTRWQNDVGSLAVKKPINPAPLRK